MRTSALSQDFFDLLEALEQAGARFIVVGAHALAVHGVLRATGDLDVLVEANEENAVRVLRGLRHFGAPVDAHGVTPRDLSEPGVVYQVGMPPRRIDILTSIDGVSFETAWSTRIVVDVEGLAIPFLGRAALEENKRAAGRPQDLADLAALKAVGSRPREER